MQYLPHGYLCSRRLSSILHFFYSQPTSQPVNKPDFIREDNALK